MARCIFTSSSPTAEYTLPYNPKIYDPVGDFNINEQPILHGAPSWQESKFDSRLRIMKWEGNEVEDSNISTMISFFKSKKGMIYYINFEDMDDANLMWPTSDTWKKVRIINVKTKIRAGGPLIYDSIELFFQPEE
jgi:hypothetical protein